MTPEQLVQALEDLQRGPEAQVRLVILGESAVAPLARFLLGPPGLHAQPRMLAAEALGLIGGARAAEALAAALVAGDLASLDPVVRLSEEAVREVMARELGQLGAPAAVEPLVEALQRFRLVEAGLALARLREPRAVPLLVECLEDPFRRERAGAALVEFGPVGVDALIESLRERRMFDGDEVRPSLERRAESARLLGELGDPRAEPALRESLTDGARDVRVAAAVALARLGRDGKPSRSCPRCSRGLGRKARRWRTSVRPRWSGPGRRPPPPTRSRRRPTERAPAAMRRRPRSSVGSRGS
jgi:HEAT repeat protein